MPSIVPHLLLFDLTCDRLSGCVGVMVAMDSSAPSDALEAPIQAAVRAMEPAGWSAPVLLWADREATTGIVGRWYSAHDARKGRKYLSDDVFLESLMEHLEARGYPCTSVTVPATIQLAQEDEWMGSLVNEVAQGWWQEPWAQRVAEHQAEGLTQALPAAVSPTGKTRL